MPRLTSFRAGNVFAVAAAIAVSLTALAWIVLGYEVALLVLSSSALVAIIVLFWSSVRNLGGDTPLTLDEALSMGAPSAAEEQKRAVLRALKDLEFERSVGKIGEQDYLEFSTRYRAEARKLIEAADASSAPAHDLAEKLAYERLTKAGFDVPPPKIKPAEAPDPKPAEPATEDDDEPGERVKAAPEEADDASHDANGAEPAKPANAPAAANAKSRACPECSTSNDLDARFCKGCGAPLGKSARPETASSDEPAEEKIS